MSDYGLQECYVTGVSTFRSVSRGMTYIFDRCMTDSYQNRSNNCHSGSNPTLLGADQKVKSGPILGGITKPLKYSLQPPVAPVLPWMSYECLYLGIV